MAEHKKDTYLCKSIEELANLVEGQTDSVLKCTQNPTLLLKSTDKLLFEAKKAFELGDEEQSYIMFMRTATILMHIKSMKHGVQDKKYYENMIKGPLEESIRKSELLKASLKQRYSLLKLASEDEARMKDKEVKDALEQQKKLQNKNQVKDASKSSVKNGMIKFPEPPTTTLTEMKEDEKNKIHIMTVAQLKNLIEQKSTKMLVIDCRGRHDFSRSHLDYPNTITIPEEILEPGMSAGKVETKLKEKHPESYFSWTKRGTYDRVILYDWNSSFENMNQSIQTLFTAMTQWDRDTKYPSPPAIVQGGIRNVYYAYPTLINHPLHTSSGLKEFDELTENGPNKNDTKDIKPLNSISYPDFEDENNQNKRPLSNTIPAPPSNSTSSVTVDRSTKPKTAPTKPGSIVPTHLQNGPSSLVNGHGHGSSESSTEGKVVALTAALDDVIIKSKELKKREEELDDIRNKASQDRAQELQVKEEEIKRLQSIIINKDTNLALLKQEYDQVLLKQSRPSLPPIRPNATETLIDGKFKEKHDLDEYVKELRAKRKLRENSQEINAATNKLPTIPGSGSSSPRQIPRTRKSESSTNFPNISSSVPSSGPSENKIAKGPSMTSSLMRPMSQDATPISYQKLKDEPAADSPRSLMKRSHSHPNMAQSLSEEDALFQDTSTQMPAFNRNLKPATSRPSDLIIPSRARQFHPVSSSERCRTGLKNLGNTCYMNSIVQCLFHLPGIVEYFSSDQWKSHLIVYRDKKHSTRGEVSPEFHALIQEMNVGHRSIAPMDFKKMMGRNHPSFGGYDQQDSHEFLTILLDGLHEELNQVLKSPLREQKNDGLSDTEAARRSWEDYLASNHSKITDLFCGQQKSVVKCLSCQKQSVTFEPFFNLSVPLPSTGLTSRKVDINQCIDLYTTEESVSGWNCPHCKSTVKATKKIDLWRLPPYLIIHLQRFYNDGWWKKRLTEVDFPVDCLDLTKYLKDRSQDIRVSRASFTLQAVSNHYGSMDGGHYTAYCRRQGQFYKFDDQEVSPMNLREVVTPAAYIFFYQNNSP